MPASFPSLSMCCTRNTYFEDYAAIYNSHKVLRTGKDPSAHTQVLAPGTQAVYSILLSEKRWGDVFMCFLFYYRIKG